MLRDYLGKTILCALVVCIGAREAAPQVCRTIPFNGVEPGGTATGNGGAGCPGNDLAGPGKVLDITNHPQHTNQIWPTPDFGTGDVVNRCYQGICEHVYTQGGLLSAEPCMEDPMSGNVPPEIVAFDGAAFEITSGLPPGQSTLRDFYGVTLQTGQMDFWLPTGIRFAGVDDEDFELKLHLNTAMNRRGLAGRFMSFNHEDYLVIEAIVPVEEYDEYCQPTTATDWEVSRLVNTARFILRNKGGSIQTWQNIGHPKFALPMGLPVNPDYTSIPDGDIGLVTQSLLACRMLDDVGSGGTASVHLGHLMIPEQLEGGGLGQAKMPIKDAIGISHPTFMNVPNPEGAAGGKSEFIPPPGTLETMKWDCDIVTIMDSYGNKAVYSGFYVQQNEIKCLSPEGLPHEGSGSLSYTGTNPDSAPYSVITLVAPCIYKETRAGLRTYHTYNKWSQLAGLRDPLGREIWFNYGDINDEFSANSIQSIVDAFGRKVEFEYDNNYSLSKIILPDVTIGPDGQQTLSREIKLDIDYTTYPALVGQMSPRIDGEVERTYVTSVKIGSALDDPGKYSLEATFSPNSVFGGYYTGTHVSTVKYQSSDVTRDPIWMQAGPRAGGTTTYTYEPGYFDECPDEGAGWPPPNKTVLVTRPDGSYSRHHFDWNGNEVQRDDIAEGGVERTTFNVFEGYGIVANLKKGTIDPEGNYTSIFYQYENDSVPGSLGYFQGAGTINAWNFYAKHDVLQERKHTDVNDNTPLIKWFTYGRFRRQKSETSPGQSTPDFEHFFDYETPAGHPDVQGGSYIKPIRSAVVKTVYRTVPTEGAPRIEWTRYNKFAQPLERWTETEDRRTAYDYYCINDPDGDGTQNWLDWLQLCPGGAQPGYLKSEIVDPDEGDLNLTTQYKYDERGRPIEEINPRGVATRSVYNEMDQICISATGLPGEVTVNLSDEDLTCNESITISTQNSGATKTRTYFDANGNGIEQRTWCDNEGLETSTFVGNWITSEFVYDGLDQLVQKRVELADPEGSPAWLDTFWVRDEMGRVVREVLPDRTCSQVTYSPRGHLLENRRHALKYGPTDDFYVNVPVSHADDTVMTLSYTPNGSLSTAQDSEGAVETMHYDLYGRRVGKTDTAGTTLWHTIRADGLVEKEEIENTASQVVRRTEYFYDERSRLCKTDLMWSDASGMPVADGKVTTQFGYNTEDEVTLVIDDAGRATIYEYDEAGRRIRVIYPSVLGQIANNSDRATYDENGNITKFEVIEHDSSSARTYTIETEYDALDRAVKVIRAKNTPDEVTSESFYDSLGNVVVSLDERNTGLVGARYLHDSLGRLRQTEEGYDGLASTVVSGLIQPGNPDGFVTTKTVYDLIGNVVSRTDDLGNVTSYRYDNLHRRTETIYADGTSETVEYRSDDLAEKLTAWDDQNPQVRLFEIDYLYDNAKRLIDESVNVINGPYTGLKQRTFDHDDLGQITVAEAFSQHPLEPSITWKTRSEREYDTLGRVTSETQRLCQAPDSPPTFTEDFAVTVDSEFDAFGNLEKTTSSVSSGAGNWVVDRTYDDLNRLKNVTDNLGPNGIDVDLAWQGARGRLEKITHHGSSTQTNTLFSSYDARGRLLEMRTETQSGTLLAGRKWAYAKSSVKTREEKTDPDSVGDDDHVFDHDALDRLFEFEQGIWDDQQQALTGTIDTETMGFDGAGNIRSHDTPTGGPFTNSVDAINQYQNDFDGLEVQRDERGNVIKLGVMNLVYDAYGHLVATIRPYVSPIVPTIEIRDAFDRRVYREEDNATLGLIRTVFVHQGDKTIQEVELEGDDPVSATVVREYVHGIDADHLLAQRIDGVAYGYHVDPKGTPYATTDMSGMLAERYDVGPYGQMETIDDGGPGELGNRIGLHGGWIHAPENQNYAALIYYRARHYSPFLKRFASRDPLGTWFDAVQRGNGYSFVGNSPTLYVDPAGLESQLDEEAEDRGSYVDKPLYGDKIEIKGEYQSDGGSGWAAMAEFDGLKDAVYSYNVRVETEEKLAADAGTTYNPYNDGILMARYDHIVEQFATWKTADDRADEAMEDAKAELVWNMFALALGPAARVGAWASGAVGGAAKVAGSATRVGGRVAAAKGGGTVTKTRQTLGRDGASSSITLEKDAAGRTVSRTHTVTKDGEVLHQHQEHIGKYGGERRFPDEWTGTPTINAPPHTPKPPSFPPGSN